MLTGLDDCLKIYSRASEQGPLMDVVLKINIISSQSESIFSSPFSDPLHGRGPDAPDLQQGRHGQELRQAVLQGGALWRENQVIEEL